MYGLYLITNDDEFPILYQKIKVALATRQVVLLQYRRKKIPELQQMIEVEQILKLCEYYQVPLIINDNLKLAQQFDVGVHLGQDDGSIQQARVLLGQKAIIGRTCMNRLDWAEQAILDGASYVAFGAIYPSTSKETQVKNMNLEIIQQAKHRFPKIPICTIGGLTVENALPVIDAGADMCAVISDILSLEIDKITQRIATWNDLFNNFFIKQKNIRAW